MNEVSETLNKKQDYSIYIKGGIIIIILILILVIIKKFSVSKGIKSLVTLGGLIDPEKEKNESIKKISKINSSLLNKSTYSDKKANELAENISNRLDFWLDDKDLRFIHGLITHKLMTLENLAKVAKAYGIRQKNKDIYSKLRDYKFFTDNNQKLQRETLQRLSQIYKI